MYPWFYVWSPRYALFHNILLGQVQDMSGVHVHPVFMDQSVFDIKEENKSKHFLTGIGIKIYVLLKNLEKHPGEHLIFSDVDILPLRNNLADYLKEYEVNDITCMRERFDTNEYNIGFMLIKSTPETILLFQKVLERIRTENLLDQFAFNEEVQHFKGRHGFFSIPEFIQSNMMEELQREDDYVLLQFLCSSQDPTMVLVEKIATLTNFVDITRLRNFVPNEVEDKLNKYLEQEDPLNYILSWPPRISTSN